MRSGPFSSFRSAVATVCLLFVLSPLAAQENPTTSDLRFRPTISNLPQATLRVAPRLLMGYNPWVLLAGGGSAALVWHSDDEASVNRELRSHSFYKSWAGIGNFYGDGLFLGTLSAGCWYLGHSDQNDRLERFGFDSARGLILGAGLVWVMKVSFDRTRPDGGKHSFPSGHTCSAFTMVPILHHAFGYKGSVTGFLAASMTAMGRMEDNRHYLSDVLFGAALGWAVGQAVVNDDGNKTLKPVVMGPKSIGLEYAF